MVESWVEPFYLGIIHMSCIFADCLTHWEITCINKNIWGSKTRLFKGRSAVLVGLSNVTCKLVSSD